VGKREAEWRVEREERQQERDGRGARGDHDETEKERTRGKICFGEKETKEGPRADQASRQR
jgi:hypothetical protein